jgi:hypothetical protein
VTRRQVVRLVPWVTAALSLAVLAAAAAAGLTNDPSLPVQRLVTSDLGWWLAYAVFSVVGAVIATRRPENRVGWLMLIGGGINAFAQGAQQYAIWGLVRHPGSLAGADVASWLTTFLWTPSITTLILVLIYFPTGRLPSRRWRWLPVVAVTFTTAIVLATAVDLWGRRGPELLVPNADELNSTFAAHVIAVLWPFVPVCAIGGMVSIAIRWRRSHGIERQQLKWIVLAGAVSGPMIPVADFVRPSSNAYTVVQLLNSPAWCGIAIALAVLRYRLFDIDRIVSRTVAYGLVTGVVVGVYVGLVALIESVLGFSSAVAVAASTLAAAALFQPLRQRVQRAIDHRFDRAAYDARRTAEAFAQRLRDEVDVERIHADLVTTIDTSIAPASISLWVAAR